MVSHKMTIFLYCCKVTLIMFFSTVRQFWITTLTLAPTCSSRAHSKI